MTNLFTIRNNRATALVMLMAWVLGLISGVANACLLDAPGAATHAKTAELHAQHDVKHSGLGPHPQTVAGSAQPEDVHTSKQPCLKVCDDSSRSLPKKYPAGGVDPGLPSVVAVLWSLVEPVYLAYRQPRSTQRVVSQVPLRHRYARLAL
jgi:hypothetical protein